MVPCDGLPRDGPEPRDADAPEPRDAPNVRDGSGGGSGDGSGVLGGAGLWSAGYEGRDLEGFVRALREQRIDVVADVRLTPASRKPGFGRTRLREALAAAGIAYVHLRGLGNPKDNRAPFRQGRLDAARARFRAVLESGTGRADLDRLAATAVRSRVAVLCFERDERRCHRQVVLEAVRHRTGAPVRPLD